MHPKRTELITHAEAREAVLALVDHYFHNKHTGRRVKIHIPVEPDDTDTLLMDYISQQEAKDGV